MKIIQTNIKNLIVIEPQIWGDERGYFFESYNDRLFNEHNLNFDWKQDNEAFSERGVLRGLHYQVGPFAQSKLVRVAHGEVLDVVVDLRPDSETYGKSFSLILNDITKKQLLVPKGFAHGYVVLSETALFLYKVDAFYNKENEYGLAYDDPALAINWILPKAELTISEKDKVNPVFSDHHSFHSA